MFETAELKEKMSKCEYEDLLPQLRMALFNLQQKVKKARVPVAVVIAGVSGAGRGNVFNLLNEWMDSRTINNVSLWHLDNDKYPEYRKYWLTTPAQGEISLYFSGWYAPVFDNTNGSLESSVMKAVSFEKALIAGGTKLIKLWLHLSEEDFEKNKKKREKKNKTDPFDEGCKDYKRLKKTASKVIRLTDLSDCRWNIIGCHDKRTRNISVMRILIKNLQQALLEAESVHKEADYVPMKHTVRILDSVDLTKTLESDEYTKQLEEYQNNLYELTIKAYKKGISTVVVFEGWDASGKGGAIRRLVKSVDARIRSVMQVSAPLPYEKSHHYLWRFWNRVPAKGEMTVFDRSWYGRVLVERVDELTTYKDWSSAYEEINSFEAQLCEANIVVVKFWIHISQEEQLKRFKEREALEWKNYKITSDDWHNREKAPRYFDAVEDMLTRTSTEIAPWTIVEGEDKYYARVKVLKTICNALKNKLKEV